MPEPDQLVILRGSGEWSALYVNGVLDRVGDHYVTEERVYELTGVTVEQTEDFMRGGDKRADVAPTLVDVDAYRVKREETERRAAALRDQAQALLEEAVLLDPGLKPSIEVGRAPKRAR